ncbi:hypothetical protein [Aureibacter tunicatorum]|uniref:Uncharacterized protein n=1 Tax=Aureibacter tunicatorum TaxID=866807 RepID=A0AAE3XMH7_9BACT|nr:hypothetical protein [Aureibacter tunicatorum]MDR6239313.1 hypothetical protein [Aureibacter tunicatorum]BDD04763.1 hypothetical protein AUTU_22460 [Aureibacter tunicatorum]
MPAKHRLQTCPRAMRNSKGQTFNSLYSQLTLPRWKMADKIEGLKEVFQKAVDKKGIRYPDNWPQKEKAGKSLIISEILGKGESYKDFK